MNATLRTLQAFLMLFIGGIAFQFSIVAGVLGLVLAGAYSYLAFKG